MGYIISKTASFLKKNFCSALIAHEETGGASTEMRRLIRAAMGV